MPLPPTWSFGPFRLDVASSSLWRGEQLIPLPPKPLAVLAYLVAHAGQVVTKETLLEAVWPEVVVTEGVLKTCLGQIRRVLGETAKAPLYISTVHRRGYRFVGLVTAIDCPTIDSQAAAPATPELPAPTTGVMPKEPALIVGREAELAQLHGWWRQALQGERQVVFITGEAGIGKTAVVDAFVAQQLRASTLWVGRGQCIDQYGAGEAYLPLLEALGRLCRGADGSRLIDLLQRQAPSWLLQLPALIEAAAIETLQRRASSTTRERMLRELAEAVETISADRPLLLVVEDLHWSDASTLEWVAYVARRRDRAPLMVLTTYRPVDAIVRAHPVRAVMQELLRQGRCVELLLPYLSEAAVSAYLTQRFGAGTMTPVMAGILRQRTNGNPLFLRTMIDDLVQHGRLAGVPDTWEWSRDLESAVSSVPESLRQLLEQQIERLAAEEQRLLEAASVVGTEFSAAAVAAGLDDTVESTETRCLALARRGQFIRSYGTEEWPDGTVADHYAFIHTIYRETFYNRIPESRRVRWHRQIGVRLEVGYGPQVQARTAELAEHFVRGRDAVQAVQYLRAAGEQAMQRCAYQEAVSCFEHALEALSQLPVDQTTQGLTIDIHLALRSALLPLGQYERILASLQQAERLATAQGHAQRLGWVVCYMASCLRLLGDPRRAIAMGRRALDAAPADLALQVVANYTLGQGYYSLGDFKRAQDLFRLNVSMLTDELRYARFGMATMPAVTSRMYLVYCSTQLGEFTAGIAQGEAGIQLAQAVADPLSLIFMQRSLGHLYLDRGDVHRAMPLLERSLELCQHWQIRDGLPTHLALLGYAHALSGNMTEALSLLEQAVADSAAMRTMYGHAMRCARLGAGYRLAGRPVEARTQAERALQLAQTHQERGAQAWILHLCGDLARHDTPSQAEPAATYYQQAQALAEALGMRPLQAHCALGLGLLHGQTGRTSQARLALTTATALYQAMGMSFWRSQAEAALVQVGMSTERPA